jgi:hypothetical protein
MILTDGDRQALKATLPHAIGCYMEPRMEQEFPLTYQDHVGQGLGCDLFCSHKRQVELDSMIDHGLLAVAQAILSGQQAELAASLTLTSPITIHHPHTIGEEP